MSEAGALLRPTIYVMPVRLYGIPAEMGQSGARHTYAGVLVVSYQT